MSNVYTETVRQQNIEFNHNLVFPTSKDTTPTWMRTPSKQWIAEDLELGTQTITADPLFVDPAQGDFRLKKHSPAIGAGHNGYDLGALANGVGWIPGLDFAGTTTAFYYGDTRWQPVAISAEKFTMHRNHLQRPSWFQDVRYGADFRHLPDGEQSLGGITFLIQSDTHSTSPNVLALSGIQTESPAESIKNISVKRKADKIAFLHNAHIANRKKINQGDEIFHYRIHYINGTHHNIPIRLGFEIEHWLNDSIKQLGNAKIAWLLPYLPNRMRENAWLHLYVFEWVNPKPNLEILSIDIIRDIDEKISTPAVFGISTGKRIKE
jgi:hypothetical protein